MRLSDLANSCIVLAVAVLHARELHHAVGSPPSDHRCLVQASANRNAAFAVPSADNRTAADAVAGRPDGARLNGRIGVALATLCLWDPSPCAARFAVARPAPLTTVRTDAEIAASIREQLRKSQFLDDSTIAVSVTDGRAVLTGEVATAAESSLATQCALRGGARDVDNRLHVVAGRAAA